MIFKVQTKIPGKLSTLIIPLLPGKDLPKTLHQLGDTFNFSAEGPAANFKADAHQHLLIYNAQGIGIHLLGLGAEVPFPKVQQVFKRWIFKEKSQLPGKVSLALQHIAAQQLSPIVEGIVQGVVLGRYDVGLYKTAKAKKEGFAAPKASLIFMVDPAHKKSLGQSIKHAEAISKTQSRILDLMNAPGNKAKPETLAKWAKDSGKAHGFKVTTFNKSQSEKKNLHAFLAVNRGSEYPPSFIIMEYRPKNAGRKQLPKIGLVGKGVTFDTGGLSIKGAANMHYMKSDMGGAAAVLGTLEVCAKLQLPVHLIGIVPSTDNCVDAKSVKPGDVIGSYSGKTIEVIDTDAEGRLTLADGLAYLHKNFQPEVMIDLATLTGSAVRTLGYHAGALFSNNEKLSKQLYDIGQQTGERLWPLPLWKDYADDMNSDVADIANYSGKPVAGAITAAKFLEFFIDQHPAWAHLDIAGVAFGNSGLSKQKSATGYGIRLLIRFLENWK